MKTTYWVDAEGVMRAANVPEDAVSFGIGAQCPSCRGSRITSIDYEQKLYSCNAAKHGALPAVQMSVTSFGQLRIDNHPQPGDSTFLSGYRAVKP
jgi:hypothetical protein